MRGPRVILAIVISGIAAFLLVGTLAGAGGGDGGRARENTPAFRGSITAPQTTGSASAQARAVRQATRISAATADRSALRMVPGTVTATALTAAQGYVVYDVVVAGRDNQTHEVIVDAGNAMVLTQGATTRNESDGGD